jgi:hypothetical protein
MRPPEAAGGGADFVLAPPGDGAKLGAPLVLDAVMPTGTMGKPERHLTSRVAPRRRNRARCPVPG